MIDNWCHPSDNGIVDFRTEHGQSAGSARWWLPAPGDESIGSIQRGRKASGGLESWSQCWRGDGAPTAPGTRMEAWNLGKWGPVMVRAAWRGRGRRTAPPHHVTAQRGAYQVPIAGASHAAGSPSPPRQPALVSCRLDNTRILATDTLHCEPGCREGGGGGGGCPGMAAVINMRVAAGGGEVNHGPARGAARREKGGSWWQAGRAQPPGGQARSHFPTINTQPCWPGRAGLGWAGAGGRYQLVSARQPSPHSLLLYCQSRPPRPQLCYTICCTRGCGSSAPAAAPPGSPPPPRRRGAIKEASAQCSAPALSWAKEVNK